MPMEPSRTNKQALCLRGLQLSDAELLMELNNDPEIAHMVVGNPSPVTLQEQLAWMERQGEQKNTERFIVEWEGTPVGTVILSSINKSDRTANLSIKLHRSAQGKGIGKQSVFAAVRYCFEKLGLDCVTAHVLPYNKASAALFRSCGFTLEGVLRSRVIKEGKREDLLSFSLLRDELA